jgi:RNA polymerase sigma-70 factor, ECF subfamily
MINGCKQQHPQSQEQLYRVCYTPMLKICSRYARDLDEAGALYNEAMLKVFGSLHQYNGHGDVMAWIRRIVVNTGIDHCRRQARFTAQPLSEENENGIPLVPDVYNRLSGQEVMELIQELPRNTALVFNLFVMEGYKHEEIGQLLGIAAGTSKWHLNEARRLLKMKLDSIFKKEIITNAI